MGFNKKNRRQLIGIRKEWVELYILRPMVVILTLAIFAIFVVVNYKTYATEKAEKERIAESELVEKRAIEKSIAESERIKALRLQEEENKRESLAQVEIETRKTNTLYENKVSKNIMPIGTYLRNDKLNKVGQVVGYYGLEVITNNEWNFKLDENGIAPEEIEQIGYAEYMRRLKKEKELAEKKKQRENASNIQKLIDEEIAKRTTETKKLFGNYTHFELDGVKYRLIEIVGNEVIAIPKGQRNKKNNYKYILYTDKIKLITCKEFEIERSK